MVRLGDEIFKSDNVYSISVFEMFFETASGIEVSKFPAFATKNEICFGILLAGVEDRLNQADHFMRTV